MSTADHPSPVDIARWHAVTTWEQYGDTMARWILGEFPYCPRYGADTVDEETREDVQPLAAINRGGFVTDCSQPGVLEELWKQRAFVTGVCSEEVANRVRRSLVDSPLVVLWFNPDRTGDSQIVVSVDHEGRENTWLGVGGYAARDLAEDAHDFGPGIALLHVGAWELHVFDPEWGRNDRLLPALQEALK